MLGPRASDRQALVGAALGGVFGVAYGLLANAVVFVGLPINMTLKIIDRL